MRLSDPLWGIATGEGSQITLLDGSFMKTLRRPEQSVLSVRARPLRGGDVHCPSEDVLMVRADWLVETISDSTVIRPTKNTHPTHRSQSGRN